MWTMSNLLDSTVEKDANKETEKQDCQLTTKPARQGKFYWNTDSHDYILRITPRELTSS